MKTNSHLHKFMMTVMLSFMLLSCDQDDMLTKSENPDVIQKGKLTSNGTLPLGESKEFQFESPITKEMEEKVIQVVKPVKEIVEKLLNEDKTGTYEAYKKDVARLSTLKDPKENRIFLAEMSKKYFPFFQAMWKKADIDEPTYQQKLKEIFPEEIQETMEFTEFLNFSTRRKHTRDNTPPAPPAPPSPENICIDALPSTFAIQITDRGGIANSTVFVSNSLVRAITDATFVGFASAQAALASNITIPGTFPDDDRLLRVTKNYHWRGHVTAISVIGCSFASTSFNTINQSEFLRLWAPVIWFSNKEFDEDRMEDYLIQKRFMYNIRYGMSVYTNSFAEITAGSNAASAITNIQWNVCEESPAE